jgi:hypothetical protein
LTDPNAAGLLFHANDFTNDVGHGSQLFTALCAGGQDTIDLQGMRIEEFEDQKEILDRMPE